MVIWRLGSKSDSEDIPKGIAGFSGGGGGFHGDLDWREDRGAGKRPELGAHYSLTLPLFVQRFLIFYQSGFF